MKTKTPLSLPLCMLAIMIVFIAFALQMAGCGGSGSNETAAQGGWSNDASSASAGPKVDSAVNMDNPGQPLGTGDWLQINGSGFGSSQGTSYVSFSNGSDINVKADSYFTWSDTQVVCRVPVNLKGKAVAGLPNQGAGAEKGSLFNELSRVLFASPELLAGGAGSGFKPTPPPAVTILPASGRAIFRDGRQVANLGGPMLLPLLVVGGVAAAIVNATVNSNQHNADPQPTPPLLTPSPSPSPSISPSPSPSPSASPSASPTPSPAISPTQGGGGGGGGSTTQWWNLGAASSAGSCPNAAPQIKINSAGLPYVAFGNGDGGDSSLHVGTFSSSTGWNELPLPTPSPTATPSATPSPATGYNPALCVDGTVPYVAYYSETTGFLNVYRYDTGSSNWVIVVTEASTLKLKNMSIYASGSSTASPSIFVACQADDSGTIYTYVRKVNGTSFDSLLSQADAQSPSLHGNGSTPYIAYEDIQTPQAPQVVVKCYGEAIKNRDDAKNPVSSKGGFLSWNSCGTIASATSPKLYVYSDSGTAIPYCAYFDDDKKTHVSKYESSAWTELGSGMIVSGGTKNLDHALAVDSGIPYVALIGNAGSNYAVAVNKYTGSSWADVGSPSISASSTSAAGTGIGIDVFSGIPEVAYVDQANSYVTVQKYATSKAMKFLNSRLFQKNLPCGVPSALLP